METITISGFWAIVALIVFSVGSTTILFGLTKFLYWLYELGQAIIDQRKDSNNKFK